MSKSPSKKKCWFSYDSNENCFDEVRDLGNGNSFHLLSRELLLQLTLFEQMVEFVSFYRDPKKCFSPSRVSLQDWLKIEIFRDRRYKKVKLKVQQNNLALFRRKYGVAHEEECDNQLKINSFFDFLLIFSSFPF